MALQIENAVIAQLIRETAARTGESDETVIETALLERLERLPESSPEASPARPIDAAEAARRQRIYAAVRELQEAFRQHPEAVIDHAELLYDEDGLPK
ncbi:MAG: type II toxin-antitoxin system VapB family antitoxin [Thermomicrobiales bacterium]